MFGERMDEVKGQQGYWHCFWLTGAGAHPLSVLLIGTVVAKRLLWVPEKVLCPLQQVRSGEEDAQGREKESFSWSSGSALKKKRAGTLCVPHNSYQQGEDGKRCFLTLVTHCIISVSCCPAAQANHGML